MSHKFQAASKELRIASEKSNAYFFLHGPAILQRARSELSPEEFIRLEHEYNTTVNLIEAITKGAF